MKRTEKQEALDKHKAVLLATLDYLSQRYARSFVADGESFVESYYEQRKTQVEKYYIQRRLDKLLQEIDRLTEGIRHNRDVAFGTYIKEKTGYELDVFAVLRSSVEGIVAQNRINTPQEADDANVMIGVLQERKKDAEKVAVLQVLLDDYHKRIYSSLPLRPLQNNGYSKVIERIETAETVSEMVICSNRPFPPGFRAEYLDSPDGKRRLWIHQHSGKNPYISITLNFPNGSGAVFEAAGEDPDFQAVWKDNNTIHFGFTHKLQPRLSIHTVESYDDKINVEYILKEGPGSEAGKPGAM